MCDCISLLAPTNSKVRSYFGKNSDREPNEIQLVEHYPRSKREKKQKVTHIEVDVAGQTNEIVISRPYWMWGAEMGLNEHGVCIGNEAIFSTASHARDGLLGMDLLRLALEYGESAETACQVMISYLEKYGQGGTNSATKGLFYDNSFLVVDRKESFVFDAIGSEWRIRRNDQFSSISNFCDAAGSSPLDVKRSASFAFSLDHIYTPLGKGELRQKRTLKMLNGFGQETTAESVRNVLRSHGTVDYAPSAGNNGDVCMHSGPFTRINKTVGSMLVENYDEFAVAWFTYSSNPCISLYKPFILGKEVSSTISYGNEYWLKSEHAHRILFLADRRAYEEALRETQTHQKKIDVLTDRLRRDLISGELRQQDVDQLSREVEQVDLEHISRISSIAMTQRRKFLSLYANWWRKTDAKMKSMDLDASGIRPKA